MKIYFADTIGIEYLKHNIKIAKWRGRSYLESYWAILKTKKDIKKWNIFKGIINENIFSDLVRGS